MSKKDKRTPKEIDNEILAEQKRRREEPTLEERIEDIESVLREKFDVRLNGY
jgi:hypothetical protein